MTTAPTGRPRSCATFTTDTVLPSYDIGLEVPGSGNSFNGIRQAARCVNKYLTEDRGEQWGPRFGFAWDITGKQSMVLRVGGGVYYDRYLGEKRNRSVPTERQLKSTALDFTFRC